MSNTSLFPILRRLWPHIDQRRRVQFGLLFLVMILASFAEVFSIAAILPFLGALTSPDRIFDHVMAQPFINALSLTEPKQLLLPFTIIFSVGALFSGLMRFILLWGQARLTHAIGADFSISMYRRTLYQPYPVHVARNSSEVISGISGKASKVVANALMPLVTIVSSLMILLSILFALLAIEPEIAASTFIGFGTIYAIVILATKKILLRDGQRVNYETGRVLKALNEGLGGIRDILIDGAQATYCKIYRNSDLPLRRATANIHITSSSPRFGIEALGMVLIAFLAYSLADGGSGFATAIPVLGALALGAQRLLPMLQQGYSSWSQIRGGQASLRAALDLLEQPLPKYADEVTQKPITFQHSITLNNLSFQYAENTPWVIKDGFSLSIPKGSRTGLIGSTGSGKSTLLDIIMGLLQPTAGDLAIDGINLNELNQRGWQAHIAHVPQAIFLADTSITENIAFGVPGEKIDHFRVQQVAQKAQISKTIESWDKQYDTMVGERGVRLSGGQRQRIGIARALYKKADVIVFDEATSALDNDTEHAVMEVIKNLGDELTLIIVAHRLTTLKSCDQIIELEDGRIKRSGSYQYIIGHKESKME